MGLKVAFILDGNRRWAKSKNLPQAQGHNRGAEVFRKLFDWIKELRDEDQKYSIDEAIFYVFSMQNFKRSSMEVKVLMDLFIKACKEILTDKKTSKEGIRVRFLGRIPLLPQNLQKEIHIVEEKTKDNNKLIINFAMAYGGREELIDAMNKMLSQKKDKISENEFAKYLYTETEPEIIIRTGDVSRTSNFLLWQSIYSEWFFLKKMWPEITKQDIKIIIDQFYSRERRFGK